MYCRSLSNGRIVYFSSANLIMFLFKMANFRKNSNCPASQVLLGYQTGEIALRERERVMIHLRFCDFCSSELEFYEHYPQADEKVEGADIPRPLLELAEALLSNRHKDFSVLNELLNEPESIGI